MPFHYVAQPAKCLHTLDVVGKYGYGVTSSVSVIEARAARSPCIRACASPLFKASAVPGRTDYYYYYYKSTDYSDVSLKLQGHFAYQI